jgi:hypothetical protein
MSVAYPNLENYSQGGSNGKIQQGEFANGMPEVQRGARDLVWAIVFVLHLIGMIVLAVYGIGLLVKDAQGEGDMTEKSDNPLAQTNLGTKHLAQLGAVVVICSVSGFLLAMLWLWLMRTWPKQLIIATMVIQGILWVGLAIYMFFVGAIVGGVLGIIGALITFCFWFFNRHRIPFAAAILATVATVTRRFPGTVGVAVVAIIVQMIWSTLWAFTSLSSAYYVTGTAAGYVLYVAFLFSFYWTSEVIRNSGHTTISGTFATWYFQIQNMPSNPTLKAAKRALTISFGSICLGSLIVALIQTVRAILRSIARARGENIAVQIIVCLIDCLLGCIEGMVRYFNKYAYSYIAIYGKSFCQSAKDCWNLVGSHGIQAIINDSFIGPTLAIGSLLGALVNFGVGALVGIAISGLPATGEMADFTWLLFGLVGALIGFVMMSTAMSVVDSGVATIFVCYAMEPNQLAYHDKELKARFDTTHNAAANDGVQVH